MSGSGDLEERSKQALECKNKGNALLSEKKFDEAIKWYTEGLTFEPENHILFSNRSAAYLSLGNTEFALRDANECIRIKPDFAKGYARKGAAYHAMKKYDEAISAYDDGLNVCPNTPALVSGKNDAEKARENLNKPYSSNPMGDMPEGNPFEDMFGPKFIAFIASDPELSPYLNDNDFMNTYRSIQANPQSGFMTALQNPKFQKVMQKMLGIQLGTPDQFAQNNDSMPFNNDMPKQDTPKQSTPKEEEKPAEPELTEEEKQVQALKAKGNQLYKEKDYETALSVYNEALEVDKNNLVILNNIGAVYFAQGKYDICIEQCQHVVDLSKEIQHSYEDVAKAYCRMGTAYYKKGDWEKALESYSNSQMEFPLPNIKTKVKQAEQLKKEMEKKALYNPELALEHKQKGNEFFQEGKFVESIHEYDEAIKHDNNNAVFYLNKSAALSKLLDMGQALEYIEKAIKLDPKYVKAYAKKGQILLFLKKYYKAEQAFKQGLDIDANDRSCLEGLQTTNIRINEIVTGPEDPVQRQRAMEDPEVQAVLMDPTIQKVLKDMQTDPSSISKCLSNPGIAEKIHMLMAAGVLKIGH